MKNDFKSSWFTLRQVRFSASGRCLPTATTVYLIPSPLSLWANTPSFQTPICLSSRLFSMHRSGPIASSTLPYKITLCINAVFCVRIIWLSLLLHCSGLKPVIWRSHGALRTQPSTLKHGSRSVAQSEYNCRKKRWERK